MSRMTKFLKQKCKVEVYERDLDGYPEHNRFGELIYKPATVHRCRREKATEDIQTTNGSIVRAIDRYFLDEKLELFPDYRIDGHVVLTVREYTNERGTVEGYEVYVGEG